jgi:hypothetical protein
MWGDSATPKDKPYNYYFIIIILGPWGWPNHPQGPIYRVCHWGCPNHLQGPWVLRLSHYFLLKILNNILLLFLISRTCIPFVALKVLRKNHSHKLDKGSRSIAAIL